MKPSESAHLLTALAQWPAPVVIGGTGGSGTRLVAQLLRSLGVALGDNVNNAEDAIELVWIYDKYVNPYLASGRVDKPQFEADLSAALSRHRASSTGPVWGWKNPRSIYLLPVLDSLIPGMLFVHVIRHGIDMALSSNQNQLDKHGRAVLGPAGDRLPPPMRSALLWQRVNDSAADHGKKMAGRYFLVRYEDACAAPQASILPVARALGIESSAKQLAVTTRAVAPRWPSLAPERLAEFRAAIGHCLERFGYQCGPDLQQ
jgi:hypothetical protein